MPGAPRDGSKKPARPKKAQAGEKAKPRTARAAGGGRARTGGGSARRPAPHAQQPVPEQPPAARGAGRERRIEEWRRVMDAVISSAASVAGGSTLPRDVLRATQRQVELVQELLDRERGLQSEIASRVVAPIDALFDLLEETGVTLRRQAEALEAAGRALEETASLMKKQSERFERTVGALRQPTELAKAAAGVKPRRPRRDGSGP